MKNRSSILLISLGMLLISIALILRRSMHLPDAIQGLISGIAIGILLLGIFKIKRLSQRGSQQQA